MINVFSALKEKQATIYGFSIAYAVSKLNWKSEKLFNGDFEVFRKDDMIIIIDRIESRVYFIRDKNAEVIEFMKKLEDVIFRVLPNAEPTSERVAFEVDGYKIHAKVYKNEGEIGVRKTEVSKLIKMFIQNNYVVKRKEEVKGGGKPIERLKEIEKKLRIKVTIKGKNQVIVEGKTFDIKETLKKLGFKWDSAEKQWIKEVEDTNKFLNDFVHELSSQVESLSKE